MKKFWEVIKKVFCWLGAIFSAIFIVLFCRDCRIKSDNDTLEKEDDTDEINKRAAQKRDEAIRRIGNSNARDLCESYGSVCDAIADGKERFRRRCRNVVSTGSTTTLD